MCPFAHIGKTLLECSGVIDYDSLTLNGEAKNIPLTEELSDFRK